MPPTDGSLTSWLAQEFISQRNVHGATLDQEPIKLPKRLQLVKVLGETEADDGEKLLWVRMGDGELQIDCCLPLSLVKAYDENSAKSFCASSPLKDIFRLRAWRFLLACPAPAGSNPHRSPLKAASDPSFAHPTLSRRICIRIDALQFYGGANQTIIAHNGRELAEFRKDQKHEGLREWILAVEGGGSVDEVSPKDRLSDAAGRPMVYEGDLPAFAPTSCPSPRAPRPSTSTLPASKPSASIAALKPAARIIRPFDWNQAAERGLWPLRYPDYATIEDAGEDIAEEVAAPVARRPSTSESETRSGKARGAADGLQEDAGGGRKNGTGTTARPSPRSAAAPNTPQRSTQIPLTAHPTQIPLTAHPTQPPQYACSHPSAQPLQIPESTTPSWFMQSSQDRKAPRASAGSLGKPSVSPHPASPTTTTTTTPASAQPKFQRRPRASAAAALNPTPSSASASVSHVLTPPAAQPMDSALPTSSQYAALGGDSTDIDEEISVASWTEGQPVGNQEQARKEDEGTEDWRKADEEERIQTTLYTSTATTTPATNRLLSLVRPPTSCRSPTESVGDAGPILPDVQPAACASISAGVARSKKRRGSSASSSLVPTATSSSLSPEQQRLVKKARTGAASASTSTAPLSDLYAVAMSYFAAARVAAHAKEKVESREERRARMALLRRALRG
ncbi:hypothetical protein JCM21900_000587 [Sporobolomyces salmonicolor]